MILLGCKVDDARARGTGVEGRRVRSCVRSPLDKWQVRLKSGKWGWSRALSGGETDQTRWLIGFREQGKEESGTAPRLPAQAGARSEGRGKLGRRHQGCTMPSHGPDGRTCHQHSWSSRSICHLRRRWDTPRIARRMSTTKLSGWDSFRRCE